MLRTDFIIFSSIATLVTAVGQANPTITSTYAHTVADAEADQFGPFACADPAPDSNAD